jgi:hypothetical protein
MVSPEFAGLVQRAEHLLWVIARYDVENLSGTRWNVLGQLRAVEESASQLGIKSEELYREVLQNRCLGSLESSYEDR